MAKEKSKKKNKGPQEPFSEDRLPQNILPMGDHVEEDKNIYISQKVYKEIHKFTKNKTTNESGGILVGKVTESLEKTNIIITGFVEAKYCEGTPTTLKFTHKTWEHVHKVIDEKFTGCSILGWIHTHPDFGIFLSEYDKFIHQNFFSGENQIAYVVDPIQHIEGFYFWINGKIQRCPGFYIFDRAGVAIDIGENTEKEPDSDSVPVRSGGGKIQNIIIGILAVLVVFQFFMLISTRKEVAKINEQQKILAQSSNDTLGIMQQQIFMIAQQVGALMPVEETIPEETVGAEASAETTIETTAATVPAETTAATVPAETKE